MVIRVAEVKFGPEDSHLFSLSVKTVSHAVGVNNIDRVVGGISSREGVHFFGRAGSIWRLELIFKSRCVNVDLVVTLPVSYRRVEDPCIDAQVTESKNQTE